MVMFPEYIFFHEILLVLKNNMWDIDMAASTLIMGTLFPIIQLYWLLVNFNLGI